MSLEGSNIARIQSPLCTCDVLPHQPMDAIGGLLWQLLGYMEVSAYRQRLEDVEHSRKRHLAARVLEKPSLDERELRL
jgi:hypothetical protein